VPAFRNIPTEYERPASDTLYFPRLPPKFWVNLLPPSF